jgi:hypothetical protein
VRKVAVVGLSVFGKELGAEMQSLVALLLLLGCIAAELSGQPYQETSDSHKKLKILEVCALFIEFGTLWCGLMIFLMGPSQESMKVFFTVCAILANMVLTLWLLQVLIRSYLIEKRESPVVKRIIAVCGRFGCALNVVADPSAEEQSVEQQQGHHRINSSIQLFLENPLNSENSTPLPEVEMAVLKSRVQEYMQYETEEGDVYYIHVETQESVWDLPPDGVVVRG